LVEKFRVGQDSEKIIERRINIVVNLQRRWWFCKEQRRTATKNLNVTMMRWDMFEQLWCHATFSAKIYYWASHQFFPLISLKETRLVIMPAG
jgi:hypothetical protein